MIHDCIQGTPEWYALKVGRASGSRVKDIMGTKAKREAYLWELVTERLTGQLTEHYVTAEMKYGIEMEPVARDFFEIRNNVSVEQVGFLSHETIQWFGASPDGLIGEDEGLEIKVPKTITHLKWLHAGVLPEDHLYQCLANLACSQRKVWNFWSFDPRLPEDIQSFNIKIHVEDYASRIQGMEEDITSFLDQVDQLTNSLRRKK